MIQKIFLLAFGISFLSLACAESPPAGVAPVAIRAGGLIDVQGGRVLRNQVILIRGAKIEAVGPAIAIPADAELVDLSDMTVLPGLVDCHTHLAFGGWRAEEFEARCRGDDYRAIARRGGGIAATVRATRAATEEELLAKTRGFLREMLLLGVTTIEPRRRLRSPITSPR